MWYYIKKIVINEGILKLPDYCFEYFDAVVRNTVESVLIISQNKIKIKYIGGIETIREMNSNIATIYKQK